MRSSQTSEQAEEWMAQYSMRNFIYFLHTVDLGVRKVNMTWLQEGCRRYVHSWWFVNVSPYSNQEANDRGAWFWQKQPVSVFIKNLICILSSILFKQLEAMSGPSEWSCFMQYKHKDSLKPQASPCQFMIPLRCFITMNGVVSWVGIDRRSKNRSFPKTEDYIFFWPIVPKTEDRRPKPKTEDRSQKPKTNDRNRRPKTEDRRFIHCTQIFSKSTG